MQVPIDDVARRQDVDYVNDVTTSFVYDMKELLEYSYKKLMKIIQLNNLFIKPRTPFCRVTRLLCRPHVNKIKLYNFPMVRQTLCEFSREDFSLGRCVRSQRMRVGVGRRSPIAGRAAPRFFHASREYALLLSAARRSPDISQFILTTRRSTRNITLINRRLRNSNVMQLKYLALNNKVSDEL